MDVSEAAVPRQETGAPRREAANAEAVRRMTGAEPVLADVLPAADAIPGMAPNVILTSGPPMDWDRYYGGQRNAVIYGALYEGLATDAEDADARLRDGSPARGGAHGYHPIGASFRFTCTCLSSR